MYVPIYSEDGEFKGYHIVEGAPKTIKRHFEMLTSGGETVVANKLYRVWCYVYNRGGPWMVAIVDSVWPVIVSANLRVRPLDILKEGVDRAEKLR